MRAAYFTLLAALAMRKLVDQRRSRRQLASLRHTRSMLPTRDDAYRPLLLTHLLFFTCTPLEVVLLDRPFVPALGLPMLGLWLAATALRSWSVSLLGAQWSSHVAVPADLKPVTSGPYRLIRHPNYLAMSLELLALGLMHSAYLSTGLVALVNTTAVVRRIRSEERVLFQVPAYREQMADKARLLPGMY